MALNFNVDPYYDDFDETKNFHRILFKPGFAVQARELTQSQTILQDQISKFGQGIYIDGSKVSGANITYDTNITTAKLTSAAADNIENFVGLYAVGTTSKFVTYVRSVDDINYYIVTRPVNVNNNKNFSSGETINFYNTKTEALTSLRKTITPLYTATAVTETTSTKTGVSATYLNNKLTGSSISSGVTVGDIVTVPSLTNFTARVIKIVDIDNILINRNLTQDISSVSVSIKTAVSIQTMQFSVDEGVWFTGGYFVRNDASSIVPEPLNPLPSAVIGFEVNETIIDSFSDSSLLDPAIAASNYQAPGADRYKIYFTIVAKPYVSDQAIPNLTTNKFIELVRVKNGVIENLNNTPIYSELSKYIAQRIYDQSGDFIVNPYKLIINESAAAETYFPTSISAGKAYINGNLVEHIAPTQYKIEKSRDTTNLSNQLVSSYYGNYVECRDLNGSIINFQAGTQVQLHNVAFGAANTNTVIGTASVFSMDYDSGTTANAIYKVFLSDVSLTSNNEFANVDSLIVPGAGNNYTTVSFSANTTSPTVLNDALYDDLLFALPQINLANVTNVNYVTKRYYTASPFVNGQVTINTSGSNEQFLPGSGTLSSAERRQHFALVTTSSSGSYTSGQFIPMDQSNVSIVISNSPGTPQATINIGGGFGGSATIVATISSTSAAVKNKVLNTNGYSLVSANSLNQTIELAYADIYQFKGVYELGNTISFSGAWASGTTYSNTQSVIYSGKVYKSNTNSNIGNTPGSSNTWLQLRNSATNYAFDNGQKDNMYDHGTITNISNVAKGNVVAVFDYFTHSGGSGYLTLNSYPLSYDLIPSFTSKKYGTTVSLRDCIDFRPRRSDGVGTKTFDTFELGESGNEVSASYSYYLSRIDKIVLYTNGQFATLRGISSYENPVPPSDVPGALTLFKLDIPAYTFSLKDIRNTPTVLRRYTMRDIGLLDKRISNLEYYTSLSLLEKQVTGTDITDSTGASILFKNGFLVDGFTGSSVADVQNPDYAASIDKIGQLARPLFSSDIAEYTVDTNQGTFKLTSGKENNKLFLSNNIVTFSYTEIPLVFQNVASQIVDVNPFNVSKFIGDAKISPSSDVWYDTTSRPVINIVNQNQAAWTAAVNGTGNGSQWNDWEINWTGQSSDVIVEATDTSSVSRDTQAITEVIASRGLQAATSSGPIKVSSTTKVVASEVIPIARSVPITFELHGMAPFTKLHTFINGTPVSRFVRASKPSGVYKVDITGAGTGYTNGNNQSIITVTGDCQVPASLTANVEGGQITSVTIVSPGYGYNTTPTLTVTGSNTSQASITSNTSSFGVGTPLMTNENGYVSGVLNIPNDSIVQFPTGVLNIEWSDNILDPGLSKTYAKAAFHSEGILNITETTVISTRPPTVTAKAPTSLTPSTPAPAPRENPPPVVNPAPAPTVAAAKPILATIEAVKVNSLDRIILALNPKFYGDNTGTYNWTIDPTSTNYETIKSSLSATSGTFSGLDFYATIDITSPHTDALLKFRITRSGYEPWTGNIGVNSRGAAVTTLPSPLEISGTPQYSTVREPLQVTRGHVTVKNISNSTVTVRPIIISKPFLSRVTIDPEVQTIPANDLETFTFLVAATPDAYSGSTKFVYNFGFAADGFGGSYPTFATVQALETSAFGLTTTTSATSGSDTSVTGTSNVGSITATTTTSTVDDADAASSSSSISASETSLANPTTHVQPVEFRWSDGQLAATSTIKSTTPVQLDSSSQATTISVVIGSNATELYDNFVSFMGRPPNANELIEVSHETAQEIVIQGTANANTVITEVQTQVQETLSDGPAYGGRVTESYDNIQLI